MAKSIFNALKSDPQREVSGVTIDMGELGKFHVARAGGSNTAFEKALVAATKPYRRAMQIGTMDNKLANEILAKVYAETVLLGWEGVLDENEQPFPFNKVNAQHLLTVLPELFKLVQQTAEDSALFRLDILEADAKN